MMPVILLHIIQRKIGPPDSSYIFTTKHSNGKIFTGKLIANTEEKNTKHINDQK